MWNRGETLSTRQGVKVKMQHLLSFSDFIKDSCPWFPPEGTIDEKRWHIVGDALKELYRPFGPEKVQRFLPFHNGS